MPAVIAERRCPFIHFHTGEGEDSNIHNIRMSYPAQTVKGFVRNDEIASKKRALAFWPLYHHFHCFPHRCVIALRDNTLHNKLLSDPILHLMNVKNFKTF